MENQNETVDALQASQPEVPKAEEPKKRIWLAVLITIIVAILAAAGGAAGVYYWQKTKAQSEKSNAVAEVQSRMQKQIQDLQAQVSKLESEKSEVEAKVPVASVSETFEQAINAEDYGKVSELMADNVNLIFEATECCGRITKESAIKQLKDYIAEVEAFNFSQDQQVVQQMKVNLADFFAVYTLGVDEKGAVLGYKMDKAGKVSDVYVAVTHSLFDLE